MASAAAQLFRMGDAVAMILDEFHQASHGHRGSAETRPGLEAMGMKNAGLVQQQKAPQHPGHDRAPGAGQPPAAVMLGFFQGIEPQGGLFDMVCGQLVGHVTHLRPDVRCHLLPRGDVQREAVAQDVAQG